jgi:hypothetical protein
VRYEKEGEGTLMQKVLVLMSIGKMFGRWLTERIERVELKNNKVFLPDHERCMMGIETIVILLLIVFILGLVVGVVLARPTHVH